MIDHREGRIVNANRIINANIAEYLVPVNADVEDIKIIFVVELDDSNPLGVKGFGESGIVGVPATKRVRELPITLDKLLL